MNVNPSYKWGSRQEHFPFDFILSELLLFTLEKMEGTVWENPIWLKLIWITNLIQENKSLRYRILNFMLSVWYDIRQRPKSCEWICLVSIEKTWFFVNFHVCIHLGWKTKNPIKQSSIQKPKALRAVQQNELNMKLSTSCLLFRNFVYTQKISL